MTIKKSKKSWQAKLHSSHDLPKVEKTTAKMSKRWGTGTVNIPAPIEVDTIIKKFPKEKSSLLMKLAPKSPKNTGPPLVVRLSTELPPGFWLMPPKNKKKKAKKILLLGGEP